MTYGIQISNPSGDLVLSSDQVGYRYLGKATAYQTSTKTENFFSGWGYYGYFTWWIFRVTMPTSAAPVVGLELNSSSSVLLEGVDYQGSNVWNIYVWCIAGTATNLDDFHSFTVATPVVHVWAPYGASSGNYGVGIYNSAGQLVFDAGQKPLIFKQVFTAGSQAIQWSQSGGWSPSNGSSLTYSGQDLGAYSYTKPVIMANAYGGGNTFQSTTGEEIWEDRWGFTYVSGHIRRTRFIITRDGRAFDTTQDIFTTALSPGVVALLEGNGL